MVTSRPRILWCYLSPSLLSLLKSSRWYRVFIFYYYFRLHHLWSVLFLCIGIWFSLYWLVLICINSLLSGFYPIIWIETLLLYFSSTVTPIFFLISVWRNFSLLDANLAYLLYPALCGITLNGLLVNIPNNWQLSSIIFLDGCFLQCQLFSF